MGNLYCCSDSGCIRSEQTLEGYSGRIYFKLSSHIKHTILMGIIVNRSLDLLGWISSTEVGSNSSSPPISSSKLCGKLFLVRFQRIS